MAQDNDALSDLNFLQVPSIFSSFAPQEPGGPPRFEYAEHRFIGDAINLTKEDGSETTADKMPFTLQNGSQVTYGEINALAGDFYGTYNPISDGKTLDEACSLFHDAFTTFNQGGGDKTREEIDTLRGLLKKEVDEFDKAVREQTDPSIMYSRLKDINDELVKATFWRPLSQPGYLGLAFINWDHFGFDARTAYSAGHSVALQEAIKPDGNLIFAYTLNAFADHFLEDSFSAGHVRTPRRQLHGIVDKTMDKCAKYMHDEDSAIGLKVSNRRGDSWTLYGDHRLKDNVDDPNAKLVLEAVQASATEIYKAWKSKSAPALGSFAVWELVPDLKNLGDQELLGLFRYDENRGVMERRARVADRRSGGYKSGTFDWTYATTALECYNSGLWDYPIKLDN